MLERRRWLLPLAIAVSAFVFFSAATGYPWQLALLTATAVGAFVYSAQVTWERIRRLYRRPPGDLRFVVGGVAGAGRHLAPREEGQRQEQEQMQPPAQDEAGHEQDQPGREQHAGQDQA